jgi:hypothetical protein
MSTRSDCRAATLVLGAALWLIAPPSRDGSQSLDGLWLSDGYGLFAELEAGQLRFFEVTPLSCIGADTYGLRAAPPDPRGVRFRSGVRFTSENGHHVLFLTPVLLTPEGAVDSALFRSPDAASGILFQRVAAKPEVCGRLTPSDPRSVFEIFAWTYGAHHGFLRQRAVDWATVTRGARVKVRATTSPGELFEILAGMIEPLHDVHTFVEAKDIGRTFQGKRRGARLSESDRKAAIDILETRYLQSPLRSWCEGHVQYARLKQTAGFLRVDAFSGYVREGNFDAGAGALDAALDAILADVHDLPALVIDVRFNRGGDDPYGLQIAERLTDQPYVAFVKRARNDPQDPGRWTAPQTSTVQIGKGPRFLGQVVELIGPDTVSAGETFAMALMGRRPPVLRIGEDTQGVYSDVLVRRLPNGWRFALPNEVFQTAGGEHFEARGVPPDVRIPVFPKADLTGGRDGALERALEIIAGGEITGPPRSPPTGVERHQQEIALFDAAFRWAIRPNPLGVCVALDGGDLPHDLLGRLRDIKNLKQESQCPVEGSECFRGPCPLRIGIAKIRWRHRAAASVWVSSHSFHYNWSSCRQHFELREGRWTHVEPPKGEQDEPCFVS